MKKYKFGFLILHYYAIDETINCVNSIKEMINTTNYVIVIVDNNSLNGTGKILKDKYKDDENVIVILNKTNLGFSGGNNVGFMKLKELKCDFIVMTNNDVLFLTKNFDKKIIEEYKDSKFAVMGPKIYDINDNLTFSNKSVTNIKKIKKDLVFLHVCLMLTRLRLIKLFIKKNENNVIDIDEAQKKHFDVVLHGCCWIFSDIYIIKFDGIDNKTFLYGEEDLLYIRLKKNNLISVYNPEISIKHLEDVSTNLSEKNFYEKKKKMYKNLIFASKVLLKEMENYNNE